VRRGLPVRPNDSSYFRSIPASSPNTTARAALSSSKSIRELAETRVCGCPQTRRFARLARAPPL